MYLTFVVIWLNLLTQYLGLLTQYSILNTFTIFAQIVLHLHAHMLEDAQSGLRYAAHTKRAASSASIRHCYTPATDRLATKRHCIL